ncbi:MAG: hypothetical protein WCI47_02375 [bacterium]
MPRLSTVQVRVKNKPRGAITLFIIGALLLIIIAMAVWYALYGKPVALAPSNSPVVSASPSPSKSVDPYDGWKSFTLKYEKFSFKYPANWTITDKSVVDPDLGGYDAITVKSPDGFAISMRTSVWGIGGSCEDCKAFETTTDTILGSKTGISITGDAKGARDIGLMRADVNGATLYECIGLCTLPGKNTANKLNGNKPGLIMVTGGYPLSEAEAIKLGANDKTFTYDVLKADPNIATAKLIFTSMAY